MGMFPASMQQFSKSCLRACDMTYILGSKDVFFIATVLSNDPFTSTVIYSDLHR
ncbi:MAG: hypothetical protein ACLU9W_08745 [Longicatena caecimuris]|uniref:hypothetical protein n=1 Tax=Longicatena caecimuris TaxID=1796635 RepID=UPI00399BC5B6